MKYFVISDIHGSEYYLEKVLKEYENESADYLIILGDILYHGARNDLPKGHNPKGVIEILNKFGDRIIAVRGNCDSEVDQMVLNFPIMATYNNLIHGDKRIFITHGHIYNEDKLPSLSKGDIVLYGHTHILRAENKDGIYFLNPGSISLPKENNPASYGLIDGDCFYIKDLEGGLIDKIKIS